MIDVKIDDRAVQARLRGLAAQISNKRQLFKAWGVDVVQLARRNARAKGGRKIWPDIAKATRLAGVSDVSATIVCDHPAGRHKQFGGVIKAKNHKYLAIPIAEEAKGTTLGEYVNRDIDFVPTPRGYLAGEPGADGTFVPLFALVKETEDQRAFPWWPSGDDVNRLGISRAEMLIKMAAKKG